MTTVFRAKLLAGIFLVAIAIAAPAQTVSTLYQFGSGSNPNYPFGVMAQEDGTEISMELRYRATDVVRATFTKSAPRE